ncbi:helix-turn-helix domain-containing protein [Dyadobacter sandarakinus]|uniref:Helix-turn-helix domain-containing protein n=2 Tax=Dyadobacter sandarakinus TaxID=2747268 RepID=A0ABX7IFM8_9BACT|nr:helix-turn-helix domain-containing protein [Dyadobacter sandarakinus]
MIKPIKSEQDYESALTQMEHLLDAKKDTPDGDTLEILALLISDYERKHYPIRQLSPIEALKVEMEEQGLTQSALAARFGMSKGSISDIINGKKQMSVRFMKFLHKDLGIPADVLLA